MDQLIKDAIKEERVCYFCEETIFTMDGEEIPFEERLWIHKASESYNCNTNATPSNWTLS